jgi:ubiquinone/menaquinone biosynthesis C-methylase UbiE
MLARSVRRAVSDRIYRWGPSRYYEPAYARIADDVGLVRGRFLDVGCGPGGLVVAVARQFPEVEATGVDSSPRMVVYAHDRARGLPNARFVLADAAGTGLPDAHFHAATAVQTAHHWADPDAILREVHRVLAPGAALLLYEADSEATAVPRGWVKRTLGWPPDAYVIAGWRRFGMDAERWDRLVATARSSPFTVEEDGRLGFYRRLTLRRQA